MHELEPAPQTSRRAPLRGGITIKRVYEEPSKADGYRVLVDRLWPRGLRKEAAAIDEWAKEIAPSTELRKWFAHDPARWDEFRRRYGAELRAHRSELDLLRQKAARQRVTLLYGARDPHINHAVVLQEVLSRKH